MDTDLTPGLVLALAVVVVACWTPLLLLWWVLARTLKITAEGQRLIGALARDGQAASVAAQGQEVALTEAKGSREATATPQRRTPPFAQ